MELSITHGNTSITEAGGLPLTITSPNSALTYMSEDFCLPYGDWTVSTNLNATLNPLVSEDHFTAQKYAPIWWEEVTYPPMLSIAETMFGLPVINGTLYDSIGGDSVTPFRLTWGIYPAAMREEAEAARTDSSFGLDFVFSNRWHKALAIGRWPRRSTTSRLGALGPWRSRCKLSLSPTRRAGLMTSPSVLAPVRKAGARPRAASAAASAQALLSTGAAATERRVSVLATGWVTSAGPRALFCANDFVEARGRGRR